MRIIHLLGWKLKSIIQILDDIKAQGFDSIQINPMQSFKENNGLIWCYSYQPLNFEIGNCFGSENDLKLLCSEASKRGIKIIVDVVCNHVASFTGGEQSKLIPHPAVDAKITGNPQFFKERVDLVDSEYDDKNLASKKLIGLPGLDLNVRELQEIVFRYITKLKNCGVSGIRIDAAKHIGLPSDGVSFFERLAKLNKKLGIFAYSEVIGGSKDWRDEFTKYSLIYTKRQDAVSNPSMKVTSIENHDDYLHANEPSRNMSSDIIIASYYALASAYEHTLYYARPNRYPYDNLLKEEFNDFDIRFSTLNELYYFEHEFLENSMLRLANNCTADPKLALAFEKRKE